MACSLSSTGPTALVFICADDQMIKQKDQETVTDFLKPLLFSTFFYYLLGYSTSSSLSCLKACVCMHVHTHTHTESVAQFKAIWPLIQRVNVLSLNFMLHKHFTFNFLVMSSSRGTILIFSIDLQNIHFQENTYRSEILRQEFLVLYFNSHSKEKEFDLEIYKINGTIL